jgi:hypothetical protein
LRAPVVRSRPGTRRSRTGAGHERDRPEPARGAPERLPSPPRPPNVRRVPPVAVVPEECA